MKKLQICVLLICLMITDAAFSQSSTPSILLQGVLRDQFNRPAADGDYNMTFALYTQKSGGTAIWIGEQQTVAVVNSVFNAELKGFDENVTFAAQYFIGMTVAGFGGELSPRIELSAAPYTLSVTGSENKIAGEGNVGIGTLNPSERLEVNGDVKISGYLQAGDELAFDSNIRFKQGSGGIYDNNEKPLLQQTSSTTGGDGLTFKPGGSSNSANNFQLNDNIGLETENNMPVIVNSSEWSGGIKFHTSFNNAYSGESYSILRGGSNDTKDILALKIEDGPNSNLMVTAGEDKTLLTLTGSTNSMGLGVTPNINAKLDVNGPLMVNGVLPFDFKTYTGFGIVIDINTNYDADKWYAVFAGHFPHAFDINEYPGSGISQFCYVKNGKIYVYSRLPGHISHMTHNVYVMFIRKEFASGSMPQ